MRIEPAPQAHIQPRLIICPKCRQNFETMRRFQMACPECGHEWEEESKLGTGDRLSRFTNDAGEYLFIWLGWGALIALGLFVSSIFVIGFLRVLERRGAAVALPLVLLAVVVVFVVAVAMRPIYEWNERLMFWRMGWRGSKNDPVDYKEE